MTGRASGNGPAPREKIPPEAGSSESMSREMRTPACGPLRRTIRIVNPLGVHQRIADRFSRAAKQCVCSVTVWNGEKRADGKNIFDLIMLIALEGDDVILEVDGSDAVSAVELLADILAAPNGEDYAI